MSQQIVIDSVYPEVAEFYKEIGLYYEPKALDRNKFRFDVLCKDRPIRKRIDQIYRYKSGGLGQEYIYYSELWEGTDHVGNDQNWGPWIVGRVDIPYAHYRWVEETHTREATEIEGFNTKYLIPFNEQNLISVEVHGEKREVSSEFHNGTKFYVSDGDRIYGGLISVTFHFGKKKDPAVQASMAFSDFGMVVSIKDPKDANKFIQGLMPVPHVMKQLDEANKVIEEASAPKRR